MDPSGSAVRPTLNEPGKLLPKANATGSGRNKVALKPGHSMVGWIRFANNHPNINGLQGKQMVVSAEELRKHDQVDDCWLAIRGKVYNVTAYIDYHPGGAEELMRGAGKDATKLFDDNHVYVNYEALLQKCYVGRMAGHNLF